jgi:hypothetical protein
MGYDRSPSPRSAGHISLMAAAGGRRYLRLSLDPRYGGWQQTAMLGHELRHALEIADAPSAIDQESVASLYRRIGFSTDDRCFESAAAIDAGRQVHAEVLETSRAIAVHQHSAWR